MTFTPSSPRSAAVQDAELVLVAHQRHRGGCLCGWSELGKSLPGHQAAMLREAGLLTGEPERPGERS